MRNSQTFVVGLISLSLASAAGAQPPSNPGTLAKVNVVATRAHARTWRPDAVLFQIRAGIVSDGTAHWEYDYMSPTKPGRCIIVGVAKGKVVSAPEDSCDTSTEKAITDFTIDSDQAVQIARKAGLASPKLKMGLMWGGSGGSGKLVWLVMENSGMNKGDQIVDIDAMTGAVANKSRTP